MGGRERWRQASQETLSSCPVAMIQEISVESEIQGRWLGGSLQVARPGATMGPREGCGGDESDMTGVTQLPPKLPREETKPGNLPLLKI